MATIIDTGIFADISFDETGSELDARYPAVLFPGFIGEQLDDALEMFERDFKAELSGASQHANEMSQGEAEEGLYRLTTIRDALERNDITNVAYNAMKLALNWRDMQVRRVEKEADRAKEQRRTGRWAGHLSAKLTDEEKILVATKVAELTARSDYSQRGACEMVVEQFKESHGKLVSSKTVERAYKEKLAVKS